MFFLLNLIPKNKEHYEQRVAHYFNSNILTIKLCRSNIQAH